jgi:hypothetical protein
MAKRMLPRPPAGGIVSTNENDGLQFDTPAFNMQEFFSVILNRLL